MLFKITGARRANRLRAAAGRGYGREVLAAAHDLADLGVAQRVIEQAALCLDDDEQLLVESSASTTTAQSGL